MAVEDVTRERAPDLRQVRHCESCGRPIVAVPLLRCEDCGDVLPLRTFYYQTWGGVYVAECIDLNLISEGSTLEEAIGGLQEAITGYVEVATEGDSYGLLPRPSPLTHKLHYYWRRLIDRFSGREKDHHKHFVVTQVPECSR